MALVFDIETNGLIPELDRIHCIMAHDTKDHGLSKFDPDHNDIKMGLVLLENADCIIGHNITGFDIPAIQKVHPEFMPKGRIIDTYVWAASVFPNIKDTDYGRFRQGVLPASLIGSHALEAWGYRLGVYKGEFAKQTDWTVWTPEMSEYCKQDVVVTRRLVEHLKLQRTSWEQVELEQGVKRILTRQEQHGVLFNVKAGEELYTKINNKREKLRTKIQKSFQPFWRRKGKLLTPKRDNKRLYYTKGATLQHVELVDFNPSSSIHIARRLMQKYDWIPTEFAEKEIPPVELQYHYDRLGITAITTPKIEDEMLEKLPYPEAKLLAEFQMLQKRCAMLSEGKQAWLRHYNEETHRIHGAINQFGTVTRRCNHFNPNLGQVTAPHHPYGKESRALFTVPDDWFLAGIDADGLEARCKGHYITPFDGGAFIKTILEGKKAEGTDIHGLNRVILGFKSKDVAKTWYYAFMYGSGNANLGRIAMTDDNYKNKEIPNAADLGKYHRGLISKGFKGLKQLIDAVQKQAKLRHPNMWLKSLDGGRVPVRAVYSALNTLLQCAGAVIMKKALVIADELILSQGLVPVKDYVQVLFVHDELQFECRTKDIAEIVAECAQHSIELAGEHFKLRCPLKGTSKIGKTWLDTH